MYSTPNSMKDQARRTRRHRGDLSQIFIALIVFLTYIALVFAFSPAVADGPVYALDTVTSMQRTGTPPTEREDGSGFDATTELNYYQPYVSQDQQTWTAIDAPLTAFPFVIPFDSMPIGQNYLAVTTVDIDDREGKRSTPFPFELKNGSPAMPPVIQ